MLMNNRGAGTVEAALAVPLFLFFIANILSLFIMYESYSSDISDLRDEAYEMSVMAHFAGEGSGDELIRLTKNKAVKPMFESIGFNSVNRTAGVVARKWTGYDVTHGASSAEEEEYVYVTENGSVYHRDRECRHLKVTILVTNSSEVINRRNDYGEKYKACERCAKGSATGLLFITATGDRYHNSASCSSLKRSVKTVSLKEVEGWDACSVCGA